jgi:chromosome segregation ATPase
MSLNIDSLSIPISQRDNNALNTSNISIKELYEELERKDLVIKNLQSQLNSTRSNTNVILNNKIANYNKEENTLRKQIIEKDKLLLEKEKEINLLKEEIKNNKIMKVNYNEKISDFQKEILELKSQIKNYDSIVSLNMN